MQKVCDDGEKYSGRRDSPWSSGIYSHRNEGKGFRKKKSLERGVVSQQGGH